jgi:hypothetical protein
MEASKGGIDARAQLGERVLNRACCRVDREPRPIPRLVLASQDILPAWQPESSDIDQPSFDATPVPNRIGANHFDLDTPHAVVDRHSPPRVARHRDGIHGVGDDGLTQSQVRRGESVPSQVTGGTDVARKPAR